MPWETVFSFANLWALPFWLLLAFAPRSELTGRIILFGGIAPLAFVYAVLLPLIMSGAVGTAAGTTAGEGAEAVDVPTRFVAVATNV